MAAAVPITFTFNVAFTLRANDPTKSSTTLSPAELWQGIKRGGRNPNDFADYVARCDVLSGGRREFVRRLTLADGAVHSPKDAILDQAVVIADGLHVEAKTVATGARSTFHMSHSAEDGAGEEDLYLTAMYELKLAEVLPGSEKAKGIEENYTKLAKGACITCVEKVRLWKEAGKLELWRKEDEVLDAEAAKEGKN